MSELFSGPYEVHNVLPVTQDSSPSKPAPPPVSPKPDVYQPQYPPAPAPEVQDPNPSRPRGLIKSGFSYGLPLVVKDAPSFVPDPTDDPLPPPPPSCE